MALKPCRECGHQISTDVNACPSCGKKNPHNKTSAFTWLVAGLMLFGFCSVVRNATDDDSHSQRRETNAQTAVRPSAPQEISKITWAEVDRIYNLRSNATDLQKDELWEGYKGKRVRWTGVVSSIDTTFGTLQLQVKMNASTFTSDVLVSLRDDQRNKALGLTKDQRVTYVGTLRSWGSLMPISLDDGVIE